MVDCGAMKLDSRARFSTVCIHAGQEPDPATGAIITPIYQTSTYVQEGLGKHKGYEYARTQNPTRAAMEANVAALEGGKAGFAFASGMAAIGAIATLLQAGDHVIVTDNTYGGTFRLFDKVLRKYQLSFSYVDSSDLAQVEAAITPATRMIFLETPTNPIMRLTDLAACAAAREEAQSQSWSSTTRSPAPTSSVRSTSAPTSSRTAPPNISTATATASAASSSPSMTTTSNGCASCRTPKARFWGRWTRGWSCAGRRRWRSAWPRTTPTGSAWRSSSRRIRR